MAACMLRNLVLRGSVREDVLGYPRLGSVQANGPIPAAVNSLQPLPGKRPDNPTGAIDVVDATKGRCPGAGRSRRHAGSPCCLGTATTTTATFTWRHSGGLAPAAAANRNLSGLVAPASEVGLVRGKVAASTMRRAERSR
jgi:hypothetical protein